MSDKIKSGILSFALCFVFCAVSFNGGYKAGKTTAGMEYKTVRDTVLKVDTVPYYMPVPKDSIVVRYITRALPTAKAEADTTAVADSASVVVPITRKMYEGEDYKAYISGWEARLDSIFVYPKTSIVTETVRESKRPPDKWHIGVTAGYGCGIRSGQGEPFIGIGISYSLLSFH